MIERPVTLPPMPLLRHGQGLSAIHFHSVLALLPLLICTFVAYGLPALRLYGLGVAAFVLAEALMKVLMGNRQRVADGHALLNGILLALLMPPQIPPLAFFIFALLGALVTLQLFGGLGRAPFHPAVITRLLMMVFLPVSRSIESYLQPLWWQGGSWLRLPAQLIPEQLPGLERSQQALRELARIATEHGSGQGLESLQAISGLQEQLQLPGWREFFWSSDPGMLGAISILAILPGAVYLFSRRVLDWKVPFVALLVVGLLASLIGAADLVAMPPFLRVLQSTPLLLLLVFYSADYVHTPMTARGRRLFGFVLGLLLLLPLLPGLPAEGLILVLPVAGLLVPWIDNWTLPRGPS